MTNSPRQNNWCSDWDLNWVPFEALLLELSCPCARDMSSCVITDARYPNWSVAVVARLPASCLFRRLTHRPCKWRQYFFPNRLLTSNRLRGVTYQTVPHFESAWSLKVPSTRLNTAWPSGTMFHIKLLSSMLSTFPPLSLVSTTVELLGKNISGSGLENVEYGRGDPLRWPRDIFYPQKLELTSPTRGCRSVGLVL
jgi:hypothetical protein